MRRTDTDTVPDAVAALRPFVERGLLEPIDVHLAAALVRLSGDTRATTAVATALASRAPRHGHVCVDLRTVADTISAESAGDRAAPLPWPDPEAWRAALADSALVAPAHELRARAAAGAPDPRPLVLDGHRLYLERLWRDEQFVAQRLLTLAGTPADDWSIGLDALVDRWFPQPDDGPDLQRTAALSMLRRRLTVVAGGPGTGKTRTIARTLALAHHRPGGPLRIALAAPTGKAAARMGEAVAAQLADTGLDADVAADLLDAVRPVTLHRLLGLGPSRRRRPVVDHDLVVVDEASMVSLELMAELLRALPPTTRLVLVGDPDQLTSVEAGTVLADIVHAAPATASLRDAVVTLQRPYRFRAGSAIAALADAVRAGDLPAVRELCGDDRTPDGHDDLVFVEHPDPLAAGDGAGVRELVVPAGVRAFDAARDGRASDALAALRDVRLLCAHRDGHHGVGMWNARVEQWLREAAAGFDPSDRWHVGRPVMITRNDPITRLANGDVGVVVRAAGGTSAAGAGTGPGVLVAVERDGAVATVRPVQLPECETFHAMTIHKSQGSEFERVVVLLPPVDSPLATRELLYTAITRARSALVLVGTADAVARAVQRRVSRASGLGELLTTAPAPTPAASRAV